MFIKVLKEETHKFTFNVKAKELGRVRTKRKKDYVKFDEQIENIWKIF